jgi:hypothetical protein
MKGKLGVQILVSITKFKYFLFAWVAGERATETAILQWSHVNNDETGGSIYEVLS